MSNNNIGSKYLFKLLINPSNPMDFVVLIVNEAFFNKNTYLEDTYDELHDFFPKDWNGADVDGNNAWSLNTGTLSTQDVTDWLLQHGFKQSIAFDNFS